MAAEPSVKARSRKRSAATAAHRADEAMDVDDVGPTPPTAMSPADPALPTVVVQSPPQARPVQRRKVGAGVAVAVAPPQVAPVAPVAAPAPSSEDLWVARGAVSISPKHSPPHTSSY